MIIIFVGGIGSGKTLSIIKELVERSKYSRAFVNFSTRNIPNTERIRLDWIVGKTQVEKGKKLVEKKTVNWEFWNALKNEKKRFSIYLDEVHNILDSRRSASTYSVLISHWLSQIRKVLEQSERDHLYVITQKINRVDIRIRDLAHWIIECEKVIHDEKVIILRRYYRGIEAYMRNECARTTYFIGNPYFKYYDSYELVDFGNEVYL